MSTQPKGVADHPYKQEMEQLWRQGKRAKYILNWLEERGYPTVSYATLSRYGQRVWSEKSPSLEKVGVVTSDESIDELNELIDDIQDNLGQVTKVVVNKKPRLEWHKDEEGKNVQISNEVLEQRVEFIPNASLSGLPIERAETPSITIISSNAERRTKPEGLSLAFSVPDMQIGFFLDKKNNLIPTHDEAAIDVMHQVMLFLAETEGVDLVVNQGDNEDFPEFSSHRTAPGYLKSTQATIDRIGAEGAIQRKLNEPDTPIIWFEGNHPARLTKTLVDKIPALVGAARAGEDDPVISVPYLCKFDESNITYLSGYPDAEYWANDGLRFEHGGVVSGTPGGTAAKHLSKGVSTVYGHTHRQELVWTRVPTRKGGKNVFAGSGGCLCRVDGFLPSASAGITPKGTQNTRKGAEKWQQGFMIIYYETEGADAWPEPVLIENGRAIFRGMEFKAGGS